MVERMRVLSAFLLALAVIASQVFYGGLMRTVFSIPALSFLSIVGLLALAAVFWRKAPVADGWALFATIVAGGYFLARSLMSPGPDLALFYVLMVLGCLVAYIVTATVITTPTARYVLVTLLFLAALAQVGVAAYQFAGEKTFWPLPWFSEQFQSWYGNRGSLRGRGLFLNANHLAWFLNAMAFLGLGIAAFGRGAVWVKILFAYAAAVCLAGSILTLSRGGWMGLAVGIFVFVILSLVAIGVGARDRRRVLLMSVIAVSTLGAAGAYYLVSQSPMVQSRMGQMLEDSYRERIWPAALRQAQIEPLFGTGGGSFTQLSRRLRDYDSYSDDTFAHNDWAQVLADYGLLGLLLLFIACWLNCRACFRGLVRALQERMSVGSRPQSNSAAFAIGALSAFAAFAVHAFFDFNMQIPANAFLAAICLGLLANPALPTGKMSRTNDILRSVWVVCAVVAAAFLAFLTYKNAVPEYRSLKAENSLILKDPESSQAVARSGLILNSDHSRLRRLLGEAQFQIATLNAMPQALPAAASNLRRAASGDVEERWNFMLLGIVQTAAKNFREAESAHREAIRLDPGNPATHEYYALSLEMAGKTSDAIRAYQVSSLIPGTTFTGARLQALMAAPK